jgi:hypothetical protein
MRFLKSNSLAIVLALLFLGSVGGQSYAGWKTYDSEQQAHHEATISYPRYLVSSDFYDNVMSNWQSEFLQISLYVMFAVWFRQRGSAEGAFYKTSCYLKELSAEELDGVEAEVQCPCQSGRILRECHLS